MEQLALAILPYAANDRWASDVYVDWGYDWGNGAGYGTSAMFTTMEPVLCSDGMIRYALWSSGWGFQSLPCTPMQWAQRPGDPGFPLPPVPQPGDSTVVPPPTGEDRGRAEGSNAGERRRIASGDSSRISPEEARSLLTAIRERADRARSAEDVNAAVKREVLIRQRADMLRGGRGPVARSASPSGRPNVGVARPGSPAATERQAAERRERADRRRDMERAQDRRRADPPRAQAGETRREAPPQPQAQPERQRPTTPSAEPSSGGRRRVPPASP
jgi:hypothetical protein